jgi:hypothetical protein
MTVLSKLPRIVALIHFLIVGVIWLWMSSPRGDITVGGVSLVRLDYPISLLFLKVWKWTEAHHPSASDSLFTLQFLLLGTAWYYLPALLLGHTVQRFAAPGTGGNNN